MTVLEVLQIAIAVITIALGLVGVFLPRQAMAFTGLSAEGPRGLTEVRAVLGGLFVGLGLAPFILKAPVAYQMLGISYLAVAAVRLPSMLIDKSLVQTNIVSVVFEIVAGLVLIL